MTLPCDWLLVYWWKGHWNGNTICYWLNGSHQAAAKCAHLTQKIRCRHWLTLASKHSDLKQRSLSSCFRFPFCLPIFTCIFRLWRYGHRKGGIPHWRPPGTSLCLLADPSSPLGLAPPPFPPYSLLYDNKSPWNGGQLRYFKTMKRDGCTIAACVVCPRFLWDTLGLKAGGYDTD